MRVDDPPAGNGVLSAVSADGPVDAWAVGEQGGGPAVPLVEHYDGAGWSPSPTPDAPTGMLLGVDALSPTDVWAVGARLDVTPWAALIMHYDGQRWSVIPTPPITESYLFDIAASPDGALWAVGDQDWLPIDPQPQPLILRFDGSAWHEVSAPTTVYAAHLLRVSVSSATDAWIVGAQEATRNAAFTPIALHWNGKAWRPAPTGQQPGQLLDATSALGKTWGVGDRADPLTVAQTFATQLGVRRSRRSNPLDATNGANVLDGVGGGANGLVAVGYAVQPDGSLQALGEELDGAAWRVSPVKTVPGRQSQLVDVDTIPYGSGYVAVGYSQDAIAHPLAERCALIDSGAHIVRHSLDGGAAGWLGPPPTP
jgi:hypothetical protein